MEVTDKAIKDYLQAAKIKLEDPEALSHRAVFHQLLGNLDLALEDINASI